MVTIEHLFQVTILIEFGKIRILRFILRYFMLKNTLFNLAGKRFCMLTFMAIQKKKLLLCMDAALKIVHIYQRSFHICYQKSVKISITSTAILT